MTVSEHIAGLWVASVTPLNGDGGVDHPALVRHAHRMLAAGCDGVVLFGTTGEGPSFSIDERLAATEALLAGGVSAARLALGTGCSALPDTIALTRGALALGLTHALILPPFYFRDAPEEGIGDAFAAVLDGVASDRLRATLYHIPQVSGVAIPPPVVARLRATYGSVVAGVKDSSADFAQFRAFRTAVPDVAVVVGNEADIARACAEGGTGTICGMANLVPALVQTMFSAPDAEPAMRAACALLDGPFVPLMKSALAAQTGEPGWRTVRAPLRTAAAPRGAHISAALETIAARAA